MAVLRTKKELLVLEHRLCGCVPLISHPYVVLLRHCDPYDLLLSTPIKQQRNLMINKLYKCTKVIPTILYYLKTLVITLNVLIRV